MNKKVLIVSEGFGIDSRIVLDDEDATPIPYVTGADIRIRTDEIVEVSLEMHMPTVSVKGHVGSIEYTCPCCGEAMTHKCPSPEKLGGRGGPIAKFS